MVSNKMELNVDVRHWRFETGDPEHVGVSRIYPSGYKPSSLRGWHCWVYPSDNHAFESWMQQCCPTAEYQRRFNSGDPMYTVQIFNDNESLLFQLAWLK